MGKTTCPKCGTDVREGAVVCALCDFILDVSFLELPEEPVGLDPFDEKTGSDIAAIEADTGAHTFSPGAALDPIGALEIEGADPSSPPPVGVGDHGPYGGEAVILGNVGDGDFEAMLSSATSSFSVGSGLPHTFEPAPVYVGQNIDKMIQSDAVLALREGANPNALQLSPFETHVLSFVDGQRPVARIRMKAGLGAADMKIAIGMLSDRNLIIVKGHIKPDLRALFDDGELDESGAFAIPAPAPPVAELVEVAMAEVAPVKPSPTPPVSAPPLPVPAPPAPPDARAKAQQVLELGLADLRGGKRARALAYVKMAAELDPGNDKARALLGNWGAAEQVAKADAEDQVLVAEAQRAEDAGKFDRAVELYKKAIQLKPMEAELFNRLGIVYALRLKDFTSATNVLLKACELAPDNLAYRSNLGKIYKIAESGQTTTLYSGSDSDKLKQAVRTAAKPASMLDRLRGSKKS